MCGNLTFHRQRAAIADTSAPEEKTHKPGFYSATAPEVKNPQTWVLFSKNCTNTIIVQS